jgi:colanic acid/amylovoran biosynthesis glycosyltransferase
MSPNVLILTIGFPYGTGETFLASEIDALTRDQRIETHVFPLRGSGEVLSASLLTDSVERALVRELSVRDSLRELATREGRLILFGLVGVLIRNPGLPAATLLRRYRSIATVSAIVRTEGICHLHAYWGGPLAALADNVARAHSVEWSFTGHRGDIALDFDVSRLVESANWVRVISHRTYDMVSELTHQTRAAAEVLPLAIDHRIGVPQRKREGPVRRLLVPANLKPVKGHMILLEALTMLPGSILDGITVELFGDGPERKAIEAFSEAHKLPVVLHGWVPNEKLMNEFAAPMRQVVVLPSRALSRMNHEGVPMSLVEAMARGNPVIATDSGGIPELLVDATGIVVPHSDPAALAAAVERLVRDRELFEVLSDNAVRRISQRPTFDTVVDRFVKQVEEGAL